MVAASGTPSLFPSTTGRHEPRHWFHAWTSHNWSILGMIQPNLCIFSGSIEMVPKCLQLKLTGLNWIVSLIFTQFLWILHSFWVFRILWVSRIPYLVSNFVHFSRANGATGVCASLCVRAQWCALAYSHNNSSSQRAHSECYWSGMISVFPWFHLVTSASGKSHGNGQ